MAVRLPACRGLLIALSAASVLCAAAPAKAAIDLRCDASAASISLLGQPPVKPVTAGSPDGCPTEKGTPSVEVPGLLSASALFAETGTTGEKDAPGATAAAGVLSAKVSLLGGTLPLVTSTVDAAVDGAIAAVPPLTVPLDLTILDPLGLLGLPSSLTIDVRDALAELAPTAFQGELLSADALYSVARAQCRNGTLGVTGESTIANLRVLGDPVSADGVLTRDVPLLDTTTIDPSNVDLADLDVAGLPLTPELIALLGPTLRTALDGLPNVQIPQQVLALKITPRLRLAGANALLLRALRLEASLLGQRVLDVGVGDTAISATGACPGARDARPPTADQQILACTDRKLHLIDVYESRGRVRLRGVADTRYAGRRITIRSAWDRQVVARPRVGRTGSFRAAAELPPQSLRYTNRARYRAQAGRERSLNLKLHRRMRVVRVDASARRAVITGRVSPPLADPVARIEMRKQVDCRKGSSRYRLVRRIRPRADGTFRVAVKRPRGVSHAVYRFTTRVRSSLGSDRTSRTFTLPVGVDFR